MGFSTESRFKSVEGRTDFYRLRIESDGVVADSDRAIVCFELADLLAQGGDLFDAICSLDTDWRRLVLEKSLPFDAAFENRIGELYKTWLASTERLLRSFATVKADYLARGFSGALADYLEQSSSAVRGLLQEDFEFFADPALADLRDKALDDLAAGRTLEMAG